MGAKEKVVLFVPGRAQPSWPILSPPALVLRDAYLPGIMARPSQSSPPLSRQPRPLGDMPRRTTGGRQGGGTAWHHQTTAPGGRWQHQVQTPRAIHPKVQAGTSSTCMARLLPGSLARGPCLSPRSRLPPPPKPSANSLWAPPPPSLSSAPGNRGRETQVLLAPWTNPLSQLSPGRPPPPVRSEPLRLCRVLTEEYLLSSPPPPPSPFPLQRPMQVSRVSPSLPTRMN